MAGKIFCTVVNCMDGRVQLPVIDFMKKRFKADYVDSVTEAGPNAILARYHPVELVRSILDRIDVSIQKHDSVAIGVAGHYDCAGNPSPKEQQIRDIKTAVLFLQKRYGSVRVIGLWVDENWKVEEISL